MEAFEKTRFKDFRYCQANSDSSKNRYMSALVRVSLGLGIGTI